MSYTVQKWDNNTAEIAYKLYAFDTDFIIEKEVLTGTSTESTYYNSNVSRETITDAWAARATKTYDYTLKDKLVDNRFNRNFLAFEDAYACNLDDSARKGININVADFPLLWLEGNGGTGYYPTYKGDTFLIAGSGCVYGGGASDYSAVTSINLENKSLTTDFTKIFLEKFNNLDSLVLLNNLSLNILDITGNYNLSRISIRTSQFNSIDLSNNTLLSMCLIYFGDLTSIDLSNNILLTTIYLNNNDLTSIDLSNNILLTELRINNNYLITNIDLSNNQLLIDVRTHNNQLSNFVNSQLLIDLDAHGLSNGYFQSSIFGGGSLTTAGATAKANLQAKGWTIVGI